MNRARAFDWRSIRWKIESANDLSAVETLLIAVRGGRRLVLTARRFTVEFSPFNPFDSRRVTCWRRRTIVPVAGNVGLAWPIIPRGRICLIYYIHCAIHRKRLPTLYCGRWKLEWDGGDHQDREKETARPRRREEDGARPAEGWFHQTHKWQLLISLPGINSTRPAELCPPRYQRFNCSLMDNSSVSR